MPSTEKTRSVTVWLLCGLIAIAVLAIGFFVWRGSTGGSLGIPDREVHAGMYDFKKEAQNGTLGRRPDAH